MLSCGQKETGNLCFRVKQSIQSWLGVFPDGFSRPVIFVRWIAFIVIFWTCSQNETMESWQQRGALLWDSVVLHHSLTRDTFRYPQRVLIQCLKGQYGRPHPRVPPQLSSQKSGRKELRLPQNRTKRIATKAKSAREGSPSYRFCLKRH